jgi:hypothetical protein
MKIFRALLGGVVVTVLAVACGSDSGSSGGSSQFAKCAASNGSGSSSVDEQKCVSCMQNKCSSELNACYGSNFNGGACKDLITCSEKAPDPCNADCTPSSGCISCISGDFASCIQKNCLSDCGSSDSMTTGGTGGSTSAGGFDAGVGSDKTCADLAACCAKATDAQLKSDCQGVAGGKDDQICGLAYPSFSSFCK